MAGALLTRLYISLLFIPLIVRIFFSFFSLICCYLSDHFLSINVYADIDQAPYGRQCYVVDKHEGSTASLSGYKY